MDTTVEELLQPISPDEPAGQNLEYDADYLEMIKVSEGVPEQQMGAAGAEGAGATIAAIDPDWTATRKGAVRILKRSKDLRATALLNAALCHTEGFVGLRDGLQLLKGMIEAYWDSMHPKLDPEDDNDPTERVNILRVFATREPGQAEAAMVTALRQTPLVNSRMAGRFGLQDIAFATGELTMEFKEGEAKPDMKVIEAAARDTGVEALTTWRDAASECITLVKEVDTLIDEKVGAGRGVDFKEFTKNLQTAQKFLNQFLGYHGGNVPEGEEGTFEDGDVVAQGGSGGGGGSPMSGDIRSTADVIRVLEKICNFYERAEPSSPVPLLLRRAQRLVGKDFWEVLVELSPDTISTIKTISGNDPKIPEGM